VIVRAAYRSIALLFLCVMISACSDKIYDGPPPVLNNADLDDFSGDGPLIGYVVNNEASLPEVKRVAGRYHADLTNNENDVTLHYMGQQGRLDAKLIPFPFEVIVRNIGIGTQADAQVAPESPTSRYIFAGLQIHVEDFNSINSSHVVVGHRGETSYTVEGKNTVDGYSAVDDEGKNAAPDGRADIRIVGNPNHTLTVYWQEPNLLPGDQADDWKLYRGTGRLPGDAPAYGDKVYVGLITYAQGNVGVPFVGTSDSIQFKY